MSRRKKDSRTDMFERVAAAKTLVSSVNNPQRAQELELAAFMSIFHPERSAK